MSEWYYLGELFKGCIERPLIVFKHVHLRDSSDAERPLRAGVPILHQLPNDGPRRFPMWVPVCAASVCPGAPCCSRGSSLLLPHWFPATVAQRQSHGAARMRRCLGGVATDSCKKQTSVCYSSCFINILSFLESFP